MDWFPLLNSLRIAVLSTVLAFFPGLFAANRVMRIPSPVLRSVWDAVFTLPLVLPPSIVGWALLQLLGPSHMFGYWIRQIFGARMVMTWPACALASALIAFPLMYRVSRAAFWRFDESLADIARTLGRSDAWIFWNVQVPICKNGIIAAAILSFARALGESGAARIVAGYIPGRTATLGASVEYFWGAGETVKVWIFVALNLALSVAFLIAVSAFEWAREAD